MRIKRLRNHAKKLPCFTCILRVPCGNVDSDNPVRDPCSKFKKWQAKRDVLIGWSLGGFSKWNDVMKIVCQENRISKN